MKSPSLTISGAILAGALAFGAVAHAQSASGDTSGADIKFANTAAAAGMAEVAEAKIAVTRARDPQVKQFAQRMIDDHGKANDQLKEIAGAQGLTLPSGPSASDRRQAARLSKLSARKFDRRYIADQLTAHKQAVALFQTEAKDGTNTAIKNFASQTLPTLQDHLRMVTSLSSGASNATASSGQPAQPAAHAGSDASTESPR